MLCTTPSPCLETWTVGLQYMKRMMLTCMRMFQKIRAPLIRKCVLFITIQCNMLSSGPPRRQSSGSASSVIGLDPAGDSQVFAGKAQITSRGRTHAESLNVKPCQGMHETRFFKCGVVMKDPASNIKVYGCQANTAELVQTCESLRKERCKIKDKRQCEREVTSIPNHQHDSSLSTGRDDQGAMIKKVP